ncbi:FAD-dependent oxidoreductase [Alphaproteobacteria bacterium]|jgi:2-octaprenyl-6-methoxyphenol hydroxylase|nr:FAD-dependent oxidoreductase [Alphaproteobacteria bacterium]
MKEFSTDVLIVGSGLVGLVAAHSLSSLNYKVTLVDKKNFINSQNSFKDTRTVAVSEGSKFFLDTLSLWGYLKSYAEPIKNIKVYDRSSLNKILFNNQEKNKKLGYVIENNKFSKILINQLKKFKNTKIHYGFNLIDIKLSDSNSRAFSNNTIINAKIIIAADGKNSQIKKIVGNNTFKKNYNESALVLNFVHEKKLNNTAYEIFYKTGPLAILPMKSSKGFFQSTIIWSKDDKFLKKLLSLENFFIKNFMEEKIGNIVGNITKINSSQIFPLSAHINDSFINKRLIYIGDAAHSIHPIAGQGWNLGVNDVKNLHELSKNRNIDIGSDLFCNMYNNKSYHKAFQLFQITDKLNSHFMNSGNVYRALSSIGFSFIDKNKSLKNKITKYAMGV